MITIDHMNFELMENYRDAFDEEQFMGKYSEVLNKYDYIVGDIGYEKLRLAGFFRDNKKKVDRDKKYSAIEDYLNEYCNFGCAYFVLRKVTKAELKEKGLVADEREEKHFEKDVADAEAVPETAPEQKKDAAREPEAPKRGRDKEVRDTNQPESDGKKKSGPRPEEMKRNRDKSRQKDTEQKQEKAKNAPPQNKTFASFQKDRQ
ncbi:YutD family protein [Salinicoccus sp. YB14-2]|uniref:YutD family protein n=1 Tax=Salinicoccus sp. YB14-2 TaxID=1572701 RepID=UPI0009E59131|nr:YutD family protein [Salinicoccus sp. YB14-2]